MTTVSRRGALLLPLGLAAFTAACVQPPADAVMPADPTGRADPEMRALLESMGRLGIRPFEVLSVTEARRQPSFADAVRARALEIGNVNPQRVIGSQEDMTLSTVPNPLVARLYRPIPANNAPLPLIVYFRGGGWVVSNIDTYDSSARALCVETGALVLSINYRQGPEFRFPAAHDDANVAYAWAVRNAATLNADPNRIVLAGESAGGNLAIDAAIYARDTGLPAPRALALIYPVAGTDLTTPSYNDFTVAKPLSKASIQWFVQNYTRGPQDLQDPRLDVYRRAELAGLPPTVIVNAEIDPLQSDGELLAARLTAAGVPVNRRLYTGVTHEFFGADAVLTKAKDAQSFVGAELRRILASPAAMAPAQPGRPRVRRPTM